MYFWRFWKCLSVGLWLSNVILMIQLQVCQVLPALSFFLMNKTESTTPALFELLQKLALHTPLLRFQCVLQVKWLWSLWRYWPLKSACGLLWQYWPVKSASFTSQFSLTEDGLTLIPPVAHTCCGNYHQSVLSTKQLLCILRIGKQPFSYLLGISWTLLYL